MTKSQKNWISLGALSCWVALSGQIGADIWCSQHYPGYNWATSSLSAQGQVGSPVESVVTAFGVMLSILMIPFGIGFYKAFATRGKWVKWAAIMIIIYGLGEGAGSGLIPVEDTGTGMSQATFMHIVLSILGDAGLFLLPLVMVKIFPRETFPRFFTYSWLTLITGFTFAILFTLTKFYRSESGIMHYRGVWQRTYTLIFYLYLIVIAIKMMKSSTYSTFET